MVWLSRIERDVRSSDVSHTGLEAQRRIVRCGILLVFVRADTCTQVADWPVKMHVTPTACRKPSCTTLKSFEDHCCCRMQGVASTVRNTTVHYLDVQ